MSSKCQRGPDLVLCLTVSVLLLFVVCTSVYMALQTRQTVAQSTRIDELEGLVHRLNQRVVGLESLLASGKVLEDNGKEEDSSASGATKSRLWKKAAVKKDKRRRRQFEGLCDCLEGPPGPPGLQGKHGRRGKRGRDGKDGKIGPKGQQGDAGAKGDSGPKGDPGSKGDPGPKGDQGPQGAIGDPGPQGARGYNGSKGEKGDQGERGPPGPLISESIHLVGNGEKHVQPVVSQSITLWKKQSSQGSIQYQSSVGEIIIKVPGTYFIYSQMYYYNEKSHLTGHLIYINNKKVLESRHGVSGNSSNSRNRHITKFQGGLFRVNKNDRIHVRVPFTHRDYCFVGIASYFGAFRVGP